MPSVLLSESIQVELGGQEPWPQDVKLFQPYEVEQILMPDNANCLAVQAFLKMCGLEFDVEPRSNAEFMSPSGRVPFIKCGAFVVSELDPIIAFVNSKGVSLTNDLDSSQKADMRAYMSLVNTVLANAELYVCWCDPTTHNEVTKPRYGSVFPWPLNHILTWQKKSQVTKRLGILGWSQKSLQEVYKEVEACCTALSERLDSKEYFFGGKPTDLDAVVYGHICAILRGLSSRNEFTKILQQYKDLLDLALRIDQKWFLRSTLVVRKSLVITEEEREESKEVPEEGEVTDADLDVAGEVEVEEGDVQPVVANEEEEEGENQGDGGGEEPAETGDDGGEEPAETEDDGEQVARDPEIDQSTVEDTRELFERRAVENIVSEVAEAPPGEDTQQVARDEEHPDSS